MPNGGLAAPAGLAQKLGVAELIDDRVKLPADAAGRANTGIKALTVIGAMLTGGDTINDCDVLRAGAARKVFTATRAPSTIGTWLRGFVYAKADARRTGACAALVIGGQGWASLWVVQDASSHVVDRLVPPL